MEKVLPIGSIVYLKEGSQKLMILNRGPQIELDGKVQIFDYSGCVYPVGLVVEQTLYFNAENIDRVLFEGYSDEDEARFQDLYKEFLETDGKNILKGKVGKALED
jgi:hypothetical protein